MIHSFSRIAVFIVVVFSITTLKAQQDDVLPNTVILKMKEEYRAVCGVSEIHHPSLLALANQLGNLSVEKIFKHKQKEDRKGYTDLSLIYSLKYANQQYGVNQVVGMLSKLGIAEYVEPYYLPKLTYTPSDTLLGTQWYVAQIDAMNAWTTQKGDSNIVIGITDTGWDTTHIDLIDKVKKNYGDPINGVDDDGDGYLDNFLGWDLANDDNKAHWESTSHGVNVSGIAAANTDNVAGISGVGFETKFLPIKISNATGILTHAYQGIVYAADHGCDIINCSWGGFTPSQFNQDVIDYAVINMGCLVIAAVGNNNLDVQFYPAAYDGVLSVAATEQSDFKKNNSNFGHYVDISAPGEFMLTTAANGGYNTNGGTSMAAPVVAGAAGILKAQFPAYSNAQIGALLQATADDLNALNPTYIDKLGTGRVNLFNGVNAVNPQFLELTNVSATDNNNDVFVFGDTLRVEGLFTNYLDALSGITVTISSQSAYVNILDSTTSLPAMASNSTYSNTADNFLIEVLSGLPFNEPVIFRAVLTNGSYTNTEYFTLVLNPDYINLNENQVATSITSIGKIGYNDVNNSIGLGFSYKSDQLLYEGGLMIGDGITRVADVVRGNPAQDQDFSSLQNVHFNPPYISAKDLIGVMDDSPLASPMDIEIIQRSYAYANAPDDKYVIVSYTIKNMGFVTLNNLYAGLFADWDIDNAMVNMSGYDASRALGYVHSMSNDTLYAGIKLLSWGTANNYSIDLNGSSGVNPNSGGYTTDEKYTTLSTAKSVAGLPSGADVAHVVSAGAFSIIPGDSIVVSFAIIAGDSLRDIQASADAAQIRYNLEVNVPELELPNEVIMYPNPVKDVLTIQSDQPIATVLITNLLGEIVAQSSMNQVSTNDLPNGVYIVHVGLENNQVVSKKIIVAR